MSDTPIKVVLLDSINGCATDSVLRAAQTGSLRGLVQVDCVVFPRPFCSGIMKTAAYNHAHRNDPVKIRLWNFQNCRGAHGLDAKITEYCLDHGINAVLCCGNNFGSLPQLWSTYDEMFLDLVEQPPEAVVAALENTSAELRARAVA